MKREAKPVISKLISSLLPNASPEEQIEAQENLREFLAVAYRIFVRLEAEGKIPPSRDKKARDDRVTGITIQEV